MKKTLELTVLSLSLLTIMAGAAVSPALGEIADHFSSADRLMVQMVVSLPALVIIPSLALAHFLTLHFPKKRVLLAGLLIYIAGGTGGGLADNIFLLLCFRSILGLGVGLVMPFSTALISDLFEGEERGRLMGLSSSSNMIGGMVALLSSGMLASISWRLPFMIYAFALPVFLMNYRYLPEPPEHEEPGMKERLPARVYWLALGMFFLNLSFYILPLSMAMFIKENSMGNPGISGLAIAFATLAGFLSGMQFQRVRKMMGILHVPAMLALMSTGFFLLHFSSFIFMVFAGTACVGFANRSLYPLVFLKATSGIDRARSVKVTGTLSAMIYLGQFLSPIFIATLGDLFGNTSLRFNYLLVGVILFVAFTGSLCLNFSYFRERSPGK